MLLTPIFRNCRFRFERRRRRLPFLRRHLFRSPNLRPLWQPTSGPHRSQLPRGLHHNQNFVLGKSRSVAPFTRDIRFKVNVSPKVNYQRLMPHYTHPSIHPSIHWSTHLSIHPSTLTLLQIQVRLTYPHLSPKSREIRSPKVESNIRVTENHQVITRP